MRLSLRSFLYDLVFNESCPVCKKKSYWKFAPFCKNCWESIESLSIHKITIGQFHRDFWKYINSLSSYGPYEGVLKEAIHCFKYEGIKRIGRELGKLMASINPPEIDILIPVPLHINKLRKREFNQSSILAREISKSWDIPLNLNLLIKVKDTIDQASLEAKERFHNIKDAYSVKDSVKGIKVGLVDDVITTGATLSECAKVLKKAGAKEVHAITLARTV